MKVLITGGSNGQLKYELTRTCPKGVVLCGQSDTRLDITCADTVNSAVAALNPDVIINAAAYTAVDRAESDRETAFAVNDTGVKNLCVAAATHGSHLIHVSTDFVFGPGDGTPFLPASPKAPLSVYGESKLAGEQHVQSLLPDSGLVVRTAWVYSAYGQNFVKSMLKLMSERDSLGIVADQIGSPTWANSLAEALWVASEKRSTGVMHWTCAVVASWYDFAVAIYTHGRALSLLTKPVDIKPIRSEQYPTPATRPPFSVMDMTSTCESLDHLPAHWQHDLEQMLRELL